MQRQQELTFGVFANDELVALFKNSYDARKFGYELKDKFDKEVTWYEVKSYVRLVR